MLMCGVPLLCICVGIYAVCVSLVYNAGFLFCVCACMQFYFTTCYVTAISTFAYYAMLSGQGWLITPNCRQLFYVRYVDWFFTTPLIMLGLAVPFLPFHLHF